MKPEPGPIVARLVLLAVLAGSSLVRAEPVDPLEGAGEAATDVAVPERIEVAPVEVDADIAGRLESIFEATGWFDEPAVEVDEGVVFLRGVVDDVAHRDWASRLASNTAGVTAVVNHLAIAPRGMWDLSPAWAEVRGLAASAVRGLPLVALGLGLLVLSWIASVWVARGARALLDRRFESALLRDVVSRVLAVPVFLVGLYLVLRISGLTGLAVTVLGGTGLLGLVIGFAFRDIAENFLASVLLSMQRPFARGDLIEVAGFQGFVQHVNTRSTLLMTLEGNHVQIPNATIYKATITNFTANPNVRIDFTVGIGYEDSISEAQSTALRVLRDHPAVVDDPEPLVLVDALGSATVNLRVYLWVDTATYSALKVRSAIIRLTKRAFDEAGISMPDEAREVVFPKGVPVRTLGEVGEVPPGPTPARPPERPADEAAAERDVHVAEGGLESEAPEIERQARQARVPEGGADLLDEG